ncbi:MAG: hypothetical protein M3Z54_05640 [Gemmatimonadota bacterium]|nr:hypothetical protein [Gemmatimonadota bacterium]
MRAELLVLRLIHILSGIAWLGSGIFTSVFLIPALSGSPAVMGQVLAGLQRRRYFVVVPIVATLTILSGLRLLWISSAGFAPSYFDTGTGRTFAVSGVAAIIAFVLSLGVARPAAVRAGGISAKLSAAQDAPERERLGVELDRVRRRGAMATAFAVGFGIAAASGMAIARYV